MCANPTFFLNGLQQLPTVLASRLDAGHYNYIVTTTPTGIKVMIHGRHGVCVCDDEELVENLESFAELALPLTSELTYWPNDIVDVHQQARCPVNQAFREHRPTLNKVIRVTVTPADEHARCVEEPASTPHPLAEYERSQGIVARGSTLPWTAGLTQTRRMIAKNRFNDHALGPGAHDQAEPSG